MSGDSRLKRMVYYNVIGRRVARAVGFLILLLILVAAFVMISILQ